MDDIDTSSPDPGASSRPNKRRKRAAAAEDSDIQAGSRKGSACSVCRRLKVKCDLSENGKGTCSRCHRLKLQCLSERRLWTVAEDGSAMHENDLQARLDHDTIERVLEDVLGKLQMPGLDSYVRGAAPTSRLRTTTKRPPSPVPEEEAREPSPGPMTSLIEATRSDGFRSQLRSNKSRRHGGMGRMRSDMISENVIATEEAEQMLSLYRSALAEYLFTASFAAEATLEDIRTSSTVLFTSIVLVGALHTPGKEDLYRLSRDRFLALVSSAIFDRFHTLDDIRGLLIVALWQPDLSWKLSGLCTRMATELNLHQAFFELFRGRTVHTVDSTSRQLYIDELLEKVRLWYMVYVLDHRLSVTFGRPAITTELPPIRHYKVFLDSPLCTPLDRTLLAHVTGMVIIDRAYNIFGMNPSPMSGDNKSVLDHLKYTEDVQNWKDEWTTQAPDIILHHHFLDLFLNSMVLRGRSLASLDQLPVGLHPMALKTVQSAHRILELVVEQKDFTIFGATNYMYSMVAFAAVFLIKCMRSWHTIGIDIDGQQRTLPLIRDVIKVFREFKTSTSHMIFSMANGFERMLRQLTSAHGFSGPHRPPPNEIGSQSVFARPPEYPFSIADETSRFATGGPYTNLSEFDSQNATNLSYVFSMESLVNNFPWGLQDAEVWSSGIGFDLLAPGGNGFTSSDTRF